MLVKQSVTLYLQTADRTRKARVTLPRKMQVSDIVKTSRKRWSLGFGVNYQIANINTGRQLHPEEKLTIENVQDGDTLVLQPLPTHGQG